MEDKTNKKQFDSINLISYLNEIEEIVIKTIVSSLTDKLSEQNLRILLQPWARTIVHSIFAAIKTIKIDNNQEIFFDNAPGETIKFMEFSRSDSYIEYLRNNKNCILKINKKTRVLKPPLFFYAKYLFFQTGVPKKIINKLIFFNFLTYGKISSKRKEIFFKINETLRQKILCDLEKNLNINNKIWISARLVEMLPRSLVEGLNYQILRYSKNYKFKYIFSSDSWSSVDEFKIFSLTQRQLRYLSLVGTPHSLNYSTLENFWNREYELSFLDKYLLWGSFNIYNNNKCIPFYSPKYILNKKKIANSVNEQLPIIFTGAARPSHTVEYPHTNSLFRDYLHKQILISQKINETLNKKINIRTRERNRGTQLEKLIKSYKNLENISISYQKNDFLNVLKNFSLHITDNTSTTILDTFLYNFPTIIILDNLYFKLSNNALSTFSGLAEVGVYHNNLNSLLNHLNLINCRINDWWQSEKVQFEIDKFLDLHARVLDNEFAWKEHFEKVLQ